MEIKVRKRILQDAKESDGFSEADFKVINRSLTEETGSLLMIDTSTISVSLLSFILKNSSNIANKTKALLSMELLGEDVEVLDKESVWDTRIIKLADIIECLTRLGTKTYNVDVLFNKQWFSVVVKPKFVKQSAYNYAHVAVEILVQVVNETIDIGFEIFKQNLLGVDGRIAKYTLRDLFARYACCPQRQNVEAYKASLAKTRKLRDTNMHMLCIGYGVFKLIEKNRYMSLRMGSDTFKEPVIIERALEYEDASLRYSSIDSSDNVELPFVCVFSMQKKKYLFVNIEDLVEYVYDKKAHERIFYQIA